MKVGDTFFLVAPESHLWIAITNPTGPDGVFLVVNMTTKKGAHGDDPSCILKKSDHPFISHDTEICYSRALDMRLKGPSGVIENQKLIKPNKPVSASVLKRIQKGALRSRFLKLKFKDMVKKELGL